MTICKSKYFKLLNTYITIGHISFAANDFKEIFLMFGTSQKVLKGAWGRYQNYFLLFC